MAEGWAPGERPWWSHVADAAAGEPIAAAVLVAAALPLALGAAVLALERRLRSRRRSI